MIHIPMSSYLSMFVKSIIRDWFSIELKQGCRVGSINRETTIVAARTESGLAQGRSKPYYTSRHKTLLLSL